MKVSLVVEPFMKLINLMIKKEKNSIYFNSPLSAVTYTFEDILNYDGDNSFCVLEEIISTKFEEPLFVTYEYSDESRLALYKTLVEKARHNNITLRLVKELPSKPKRIDMLRKHLRLYKSTYWVTTTGDVHYRGKLKRQEYICLNYFSSCKNDLVVGKNNRWSFLEFLLTTSLHFSTVVAAQTGVKLDKCEPLGFPRNDTLFKRKNSEQIMLWLSEELGYTPQKIFVYAPTYRDYEKGNNECRDLFGYELPDIEDFLFENKAVIVCKLHNLQDSRILDYPNGVVKFKYTYDFSFYDLLSISDCLITDYSSVGYDYILLDRPIIYNLYDYERYKEDRGVSYEPYSEYCPGEIVENAVELTSALTDVISGIDNYKEKRQRLCRIFHKHADQGSTGRVVKYIYNKMGVSPSYE